MNFKKIFLLFLILCLFLTAAACTGNTPGKSGEEDLKERVTDGGRLPLEDAELAEHQPHHILLKGSIDREVENFLEKHRAEINDDMSDLDKNIYRIRFPEEKALTDKIEKLRQFSAVAEAEPNYKVNKFPVAEEDDMVQKQSSNLTGTEDKYAGNLWGIAAVNAVQAWNSSTGEDVVIALIDTGVEEDHPDLSGKVLEGFNVFKNNTETEDFHDHGTHVAGTAAAKAGGGVVGVAKDADILPIKVFHEEGHPTYTFEIARGINWLTDWAEENDKEIVANMSLGGFYYSNIVQNAIDEARSEGIVFVVAMGNSAMVDSQYPARYEGVISAGAIDGRYELANFTSRGDWMSAVAPGTNVVSSVIEENYGVKSGTSMSAPHVSGVAALLLSQEPDLTPAEVKDIIETTASRENIGMEDDFNSDFGHGLVDAEAAMDFDSDELETAHSLSLQAKRISGSGELIPAYKSRGALYDENGEFLQDTKTDKNGEAIFHDLSSGKYELSVYYSFADEWPRKDFPVEDDTVEEIQLGHGYSYLTETKNIEIGEKNNLENKEINITLNGGVLQNIKAEINEVDLISWLDNFSIAKSDESKIFKNLSMPAYELQDYSLEDDFTEINLVEKSEEEIEVLLDFLQNHPGNILLSEDYYYLTGEFSPKTLGNLSAETISETTEVAITGGEFTEANFSNLDLPDDTGVLGLNFHIKNESGDEINEMPLHLELKFKHNGETVDNLIYEENTNEFIEEKTSIALLSEPGNYEIIVQGGVVYDPDDPVEYRKVGYKEVTTDVGEDEVVLEPVEMELN